MESGQKKQRIAGSRHFRSSMMAIVHVSDPLVSTLTKRMAWANHDGIGTHDAKGERNVFDTLHPVATSLPSGKNMMV